MSTSKRVQKLTSILDVAKAMTVERDLDRLLDMILEQVKTVVDADRCTLFVVDRKSNELWSRIAHDLEVEEIRLPMGQGIAGHVAESDQVINIADAYEDDRFNRKVDVSTGYTTRSILCVPMRGAKGEVVGVIQALNSADGEPFDDEDEELLLAFGGQAGSAIQNALLNEAIEALMEGMVRASVVAIESRDPTTSGHSERVAALTVNLARVIDSVDGGQYGSTHFGHRELRELRYASLLHDFGKVGVREHVLVKAEKLQPWDLEKLEMRFALARVGLERDFYKDVAEGCCGDPLAARQKLDRKIEQLNEFWDFVESCNRPTVLEEGGFDRLREIAAHEMPGLHGLAPLLTDQEVKLLSIRRGSLSAEERKEIESHVSHTFRFLQQIPWTRDLSNVPDIAAAHHEKLDGSGYPRGLEAAEIPVGSRMMTISDIYDALTANDRPYKKAMSPQRAINILHSEAKRGLLDETLVEHFVAAGVPQRALNHEY